ncbi:conserved hypothetical protein [Histoplasma capsulatum H143]|uniref:Oligopeptide transporter n=1 Tax=Ajellomyces capsulatus (strain H143) TaxID=544712 RepID=C6H4M6_AJECH|nr:conserved hypothetical protein [Histoplasma capsulatum H143]
MYDQPAGTRPKERSSVQREQSSLRTNSPPSQTCIMIRIQSHIPRITHGMPLWSIGERLQYYLGLKAGWTTSANIFGSIVGFAVLKSWTKYTSQNNFGPHENNIVQTAATAAGGLSNVFVSAIPALYQLGLLSVPVKDFFRITTLTAIGGYFGLLTIAPLRNFFLVQVARELNLIFPSSSATAITIRSMHQAASGASMARRKLAALLYAFIFAVLLRVASQYAIGILWSEFSSTHPPIQSVQDWHPFTWLVSGGVLVEWAMSMESWGWIVEWTPAFIGSGMLVGINVAVSFTAGSVLAWGIIGPYLVRHGLAFGEPASTDSKWSSLMSYSSLSKDFATASHPSPRYWLLWPGVITMAAVALAGATCLSMACVLDYWSGLHSSSIKHSVPTAKRQPSVYPDDGKRRRRRDDSKIVSKYGYLMGDFRVGYLLGTSPRLQYAAQLIGTLFATFFAPSIFLIFATAYPCILSTENNPPTTSNNSTTTPTNACEFSSPSVAAWRAVAVAATEPVLPIPHTSLTFSIVMAIIGVLMIIIRHSVWVGKWERMRAYHPNVMILAMAFTLPSPQYGIAMLIGSLMAVVWHWKAPLGYEAFGYAVAAGLMAGEGIGGTINALLSVLGAPMERRDDHVLNLYIKVYLLGRQEVGSCPTSSNSPLASAVLTSRSPL